MYGNNINSTKRSCGWVGWKKNEHVDGEKEIAEAKERGAGRRRED